MRRVFVATLLLLGAAAALRSPLDPAPGSLSAQSGGR